MAAFWYRVFNIVKIGYLLKAFLVGTLLLLSYALGVFLSTLFDAYYLEDTVIFTEYQSNLVLNKDKTININEFKPLIISNILNTESAPSDLFESNNKPPDYLDKVKLLGSLLWTDRVLAILELENQVSVVLKNEKIPKSDIELVEVKRSSVLVRSDGNEKWIDIEAPKFLASNRNTAPVINSNSPPPSNPQPSVSLQGGIKSDPIVDGRKNVFIAQDRLNQELQNFAQLLSQARLYPNFKENGEADGFVIDDINQGSIYEQVGIQNNDVVRKVNGQSLDSPEKAFELFKLLRNEKFVQVEVFRGGATLNLDLHID